MQDDSPVGLDQGLRIGGKYGYRIEGDTASLNADLAIVDDEAHRTAWALQLWACERPYEGGLLRGTKVAEVPVAFPSRFMGPTLLWLSRHDPELLARVFRFVQLALRCVILILQALNHSQLIRFIADRGRQSARAIFHVTASRISPRERNEVLSRSARR